MKGNHLVILLLFLFVVTSCDGFKVSDNGDLDGMWHLIKVDSIHNGISANISNSAIFWSFQADLLYVDDKDLLHEPCLLRFKFEDNQLMLNNPYIYNNEDEADEVISDASLLRPYGINGLEETFEVEKLNSKSMALKSKTLTLSFKKY